MSDEPVTPIQEDSSEAAPESDSSRVPETPTKQRRPQRRGSVFFPLLLILAGVVFLFYNLNAGGDDFWNMLLNFWPVILIALGLDNIWRQEGVTGAAFLIGVGTVFLLGNFGYLEMSVWQVLLTLWPVMLLGIGIDILIGRRRSLWLNLLGFLVMIVLIAGVLWISGLTTPGEKIASGQQVEFQLQDADKAEIEIVPASGTLIIEDLTTPDLLLAGSVPEPGQGQTITQKYELVDQTAYLSLRSEGGFIYIPGPQSSSNTWELGITREAPIKLQVDLGAGEAQLDLSDVLLSNLNYQIGVGTSTITLPGQMSYEAKIEAAIGTVTIDVPNDVGVKIHISTALVTRSLPSGYTESVDNVFNSPNYEQAEHKIELFVNLAIGTVTVK